MNRREFLATHRPCAMTWRRYIAIANSTALLLTAGCGIVVAQGTDDSGVANVPIPSDAASREALRLSAERSALRLGGFDFFPYATAGVRYDDNVLISHKDQISDVRWSLAPGLSVMGGDVATYVPGSVTVEQLRNYLYYSLADDLSKPKRFLGLDYSPAFNLYTDHSNLDHIDHSVSLSAGYALTKSTFGIDADFDRADVKNNTVGGLLTTTTYGAQMRGRYDVTDRTWADARLGFQGIDYQGPYQGYTEPEIGASFNRRFSEKLTAGLGAGAGIVLPEDSDDQTYEQLLAQASYYLSEKLLFRPSVGVEFRQYENGESGTIHPVFSLSSVYQPTSTTSLTLEGHRRDQPSAYSGYNYQTYGFGLGLRQLLWNQLYGGANVGYDFVEYRDTARVVDTNREDSYLTAGVNLSYDFNRNWRTRIYYDYRRNDSNDDIRTYSDNIVGLDLIWRF